MDPASTNARRKTMLRAARWVVVVALLGVEPAAQPDPSTGYSGDMRPYRAPRVPIFFPPNPPPLGRAIARLSSPATGRLAAPPELAAYVNELFYPPLGTRLATHTLSDKLRRQLEQFRTAKLALQTELRTELERLRDVAPGERVAPLRELSRQQTPKIAALEQTAEQLRRDMITGDHTWGALREWRLGDGDRRGFSPVEIAQVMRGYAFYQNGLLPAQRRLLREISLELLMAGDNTERATAAQPHLFFPPEPARVLLPDNTPPQVAAKMTLFQTKKSELKKELYDAVYRHDGYRFSFLSGVLRKLVEKQAPRLAELETLAEEIRVGLAEAPEPSRITERSPLPAALQNRVTNLIAEVGAAQRDATVKLQSILAAARDIPLQANYRFEADGLRFVVIAARTGADGRRPTPEELARVETVRAEFTAVAATYGSQLAECVNERDAIAADIQKTLGLKKADAVAQALSAAIRIATARESEDAYREYRLAVFQPGLSPEQRRLLFDAVVEKLELPLPRGELQPVQRDESW